MVWERLGDGSTRTKDVRCAEVKPRKVPRGVFCSRHYAREIKKSIRKQRGFLLASRESKKKKRYDSQSQWPRFISLMLKIAAGARP